MAPRRSVGRTTTATPARTTRATSAIAIENSGGRRSTRATSQQPGVKDDVVNNPQLPELQTQQSYAYGSTKTPTLPEQLGSKDPMSLRQIANNIDDEIDEADKHLENHVMQKQKELEPSPPVARTRRTTSRDQSRAPSAQPQPVRTEKEARIAAWADSLDEDHLEDIPEEESTGSEVLDGASHRDTEPSSFPSVILDHSYNYERGLRRPRPLSQSREQGPSSLQRLLQASKDASANVREKLGETWTSFTTWTGRMGGAITAALKSVPDSPLLAGTVTLLAATILITTTGFFFCFIYTRILCDPISPSIVALNLQKLCGTCTTTTSSTFTFSPSDTQDLTKITTALSALNKQILSLEHRLSRRIESNHAALESEIASLHQQHTDLTNRLSTLQYSENPSSSYSDGIASPLLPKVNFFSLSNGATVNPIRSSPTRARQKSLPLRLLLKMAGLVKYHANPPSTALEPWHDVGDCWCGPDVKPGQDLLRLVVSTREMVYPQELVVEHPPWEGSLRPETTPRVLELWADFGHVSNEEWGKLGLGEMQQGNVLGGRWARLGLMEYVSGEGRGGVGRGKKGHVQSFRLDVNQYGLFYAAREFVVRVKEGYGGSFACLYRVRLHGVPVEGSGDEETRYETE